jgi:drug/metabolite transporter (DMT)-like permease
LIKRLIDGAFFWSLGVLREHAVATRATGRPAHRSLDGRAPFAHSAPMSEPLATPRPNGRLLGVHALMLVATIFLATSFPVGHEITQGMDPTVLMMIRFAMAIVLFAPYVAWREGLRLPSPSALARYAAIGATMVGYVWCMFEALRHTSALNTGALVTLVPGLSAIFSAVLLRERLGLYRILALVLATIGALWVVFRGDPDRMLAVDLNIGDGIFFAGCVSLGLYTPFIRLLKRDDDRPLTVTFWIIVTSFLWLVIASNTKIVETDYTAVGMKVYGGAAYLAVFTTIITFFIFQYCTPRIGATRAIAYNYLFPAFVLVLVWAIGQETPPLMVLPGVAIVLAASVVVQQGAVRDKVH